MEFDKIETERLVGTKIEPDDLGLLYRMCTNEEVMYTLGGTKTFRETKEMHQRMVDHWEKHGYGIYIFRDKKTGDFVGRGGFRRLPLDGKEETEIMYALMPAYWRKGLALEMAKRCIEIGFEHLKLESLVAFTLTDNKNSQKVMEKAGFKFEKNFTYSNLPHVLYRLNKN